jgi:hypothetical protein
MRKDSDSKGLITVVVLWALLLFTLIILGLAFRSSLEMKMAGMSEERTKAYLVGWAGMQRVMEILRQDDPSVDSLRDDWAAQTISQEVENGKYEVEIIYDEERYVDLNFADAELLKRVFGDDPVLVPSILDWIDADDIPRTAGAETADYYQQLGYAARNGPLKNGYEINWIRGGEKFRSTSMVPDGPGIETLFGDLRLRQLRQEANCAEHRPSFPRPKPGDPDWEPRIPGPGGPWSPGPGQDEPVAPPYPPPPPLLPDMPSYAEYTVYGDGLNNLNTATARVLVALGLRPAVVEKVLRYRALGNVFTRIESKYIIEELISKGLLSPDDEEGKASIRWVVNSGRLKISSSYFRVMIRATASRKAKYQAVAVIHRQERKCRIVAWWEMGWW